MSSTGAVAPSHVSRLNCDDFIRSTRISTSSQESSASGSPKPAFDILTDGWVSSFDEDGNFLEVSFEASPDNESVLLMGGSASEAELNQHFFPRMSIDTSALSSAMMVAPRISTLKNPISTLKNPISRLTKKLSEEDGSLEREHEPVPVSSGKKRRRNKKLAKRISKIASKVVPKRTSEAPSNLEQAPREANTTLSRRSSSVKKLKKKIMKRISKKGPLLRISKIGRKSSAEGAFPSVPGKDRWEVSSLDCAADSISPRDFDEINELGVTISTDFHGNDEVPANSTDETSETSCGGSEEEAFTPNMAETTTLYHDQRIPSKWGMNDEKKKGLALDLGEPTDESLGLNMNKACKDGEKSTTETSNCMPMQEQLDIFTADETLSCHLEELMNNILKEGESRQRSRSACARTDSTEFADLKISCSNSTGGTACPRGSRDDSMTPISTIMNELISPASTTAPVFTQAQVTTPLKTIVIRKTQDAVSPTKSPKPMGSDTEKRPQSLAGRTPSSTNKNGSASKKQFNYRTNRKPALTPTRLQMDQVPSSPIGDLHKSRRRHLLKKTVKRGIRLHPVASTTVALSAVLLFVRNFV
mmetsp:Transcript_9219/g.21976  ORF Transcript_9219/g.21976 Transcript_9219/m.21976 type:complete len:588 (+) Transcript_9219:215-1978(+)